MRLSYVSLMLILFSLIVGCSSFQISTQNNEIPSTQIESDWQDTFNISSCSMHTTGENEYFILEPGFQLVLEGGTEVLIITVLDETELVDGVETRIAKSENGKMESSSRYPGITLLFVARPKMSIILARKWIYSRAECSPAIVVPGDQGKKTLNLD